MAEHLAENSERAQGECAASTLRSSHDDPSRAKRLPRNGFTQGAIAEMPSDLHALSKGQLLGQEKSDDDPFLWLVTPINKIVMPNGFPFG